MTILGLGDEETSETLYIKYMAQARVWKEGDDEFDLGKCKIICDMDSVKTGWMFWHEVKGQPPEKSFASALGEKIASPGRGWKVAFQCDFSLNGERKIWESCQKGATMGFDVLFDEMSAAREGNKLAELKWEGAKPIQIGKGSTSIPKWSIVGWVDRPIELQQDLYETNLKYTDSPAEQW